MRPLRLHQLYCGWVGAGGVLLFTVPAGERWLVTDLRVDVSEDLNSTGVTIYNGTDHVSMWSLAPPYVPWQAYIQSDMFVVVEAGQSVWGHAYGTGTPQMGILMSGHKFVLP